ncbi:hypothetical protein CL655_03050 [bacterium]|nr:hypothetical protein [bacterium]|tara:strand:+ start:3873 stop:4475 length:603 start_codon:yes stop_codon:yes gene_type:complete
MKIRKLIGILVVAVTLPATAMAWGDDWAAEADANADGYSDGLVTEGRGGVMTAGGSAALARADTSPAYATGYAADERGILMGSAGRNGASGDFLQESNADARADLNDRDAPMEARATAEGSAAYNAQASGANRQSGGLAAGRAGTEAFALDVPGRRGDRANAEADQTSFAAAASGAADRNAAAAGSSARASSRAEAASTR